MNESPIDPKMVYVGLAAAAGSIVALYSMEWRKMNWAEIAFTLFVGFAWAIFAVPYIGEHLIGLNMTNPKEACGVTFIGGALWNSLVPIAITSAKQWIKRKFGNEGTLP